MADRRGSADGQDFRELTAGPNQHPIVGTWRQAGALVMHRDASLPEHCLVTNAPTDVRYKRTFGYVPGIVGLTILLSPFIWLLVRWLVRAQIELSLPLAAEYVVRERRLRQMRTVFAWIGCLMFVAGVWQLIDPRLPVGGWEMILGGILLAAMVFIWSFVAATRLRVVRYEEPYVWLRGVHADLLEQLPQWPYE